jgi:hypothetical protein
MGGAARWICQPRYPRAEKERKKMRPSQRHSLDEDCRVGCSGGLSAAGGECL